MYRINSAVYLLAANKTTEHALKLQLSLQFSLPSPPRKQGLPISEKTDVKGERGHFAVGQKRKDFQGKALQAQLLAKDAS